MPLTSSHWTLRLTTHAGPAIYAERTRSHWNFSLPNGRAIPRMRGSVHQVVAIMREHAGAWGGPQVLSRKTCDGWEDYDPAQSVGGRPRKAELSHT